MEQMYMSLFRVLIAVIMLLSISACASTSLDNNLDTTVEGKGNNIVFSWTNQHPFAQNYKTARMQLIAEYRELDMDGNTRPVKQVVSRMSRDFPEINSKVFTLPQKLGSIPDTTNVCLYIAMNNQAVPVRTSVNGKESSRFAFPLWQQSVYKDTKEDFYNQVKRRAEDNLRSARESEQKAISSPFHELNNFNAVLQRENVSGMNKVTKLDDCNSLLIEPKPIAKTLDILPADQIQSAAANICTNASLYSYDNYINKLAKASTKDQRTAATNWLANRLNMALILPTIFRQQTALQAAGFFDTPNFASIKSYYELFSQWATGAQKYQQKSNVYKPADLRIWTSPYALEAGKVDIFMSLLGVSEKSFTPAQIKEVVINEWTEISYCTFDMVKHLNTKRKSYQLNLENAPKRAVASTKYFRNYCATVFENHDAVVKKYTQQRIEAERKLEELNKQLSPTSMANTEHPSEEILNQNYCKI
jgi:hypothetical protein